MRPIIPYTLRLSALLCALIAVACVNDNESCPPIGQTEQYVINLRIVTRKAQTRTTRTGDHEKESATAAEDHIDIAGGDFLVLVFDGYGRLIQRFEPSSTVVRNTFANVYELSGVLGDTSAERIQVAVAANWRSMDAYDAYGSFVLGHTFMSDMYGDGDTRNFTLPNPDGGWQPNIEAERTVPMYGCSDVKPLGDAKPGADDKNRYELDLGEINMLRAVAKIEIADCLPEGLEIDPDVTLSSYNTQGRLIPDATANPDWNKADKQVAKPTLPTAPKAADKLRFFAERKKIGDTERTVYSAYVTETDLTANRPHVNLTVKDSDIQYSSSKDYQMAVDNYTDGTQSSTDRLEALLRNHIYRYEIKSASNKDLKINCTICPMGSGIAEIPDFE